MRHRIHRLGRAAVVCGALAAAAAAPARGATYHVAPDPAPGGDGSPQRPFSVRHVLRSVALKGGDEVVFQDGVYGPANGGVPLDIEAVGTEKAPVIFRAENRHRAVLDGGTPLKGWSRPDGGAAVWQCRVSTAPRGLLVNGESLLNATSRWRRDGRQTLEEGMFAVVRGGDGTEGPREGGATIRIHPWGGKAPTEAYALGERLVALAGAYTVVDGFVLRRAVSGAHVSGRCVHTYQLGPGVYRDLCGLVHHVVGSFNILRNCVIRDMAGSAVTSNESRFNLIEDNVIYNAGTGQGDHGIYVSQGAEDLTLRRNIWWRISGGAVHIYSGSGIDSPRSVVVAYNIFGPDKRGRCFPVGNRKSCAVYVWGGKRWAGHNRIVRNVVIGPNDRAISMHRCHFNLIANNTFLGTDGAAVQIGSSFGNLVVNNILEYSPGGREQGTQERPGGYVSFLDAERGSRLSIFRNNLLLPAKGAGDVPAWMQDSKRAGGDPFLDRQALDFGLKPDSEAVDAGVPVPDVTVDVGGRAPDAGALESGDPVRGERSRLPAIPKWLLEEWPLSNRGR